ncbi:CLUMA_CG001632, isoform A [Clunio marinus]|uniref:CLUMA_CG001632, isoform A n=1 Tax=Clunio marinus TaxID=568069 RepID=A0A1J1HIK8_9DIPT|nr:CLUMA_CG001632, isoform A [Clunio marinus]
MGCKSEESQSASQLQVPTTRHPQCNKRYTFYYSWNIKNTGKISLTNKSCLKHKEIFINLSSKVVNKFVVKASMR